MAATAMLAALGTACGGGNIDGDMPDAILAPPKTVQSAPVAVDTCLNGTKDGDETAVDCGGSCPSACGPGEACRAPSDCKSNLCSSGFCATAACGDQKKNGNESDVDCGGACGATCAVGAHCNTSADCDKGVCSTSGTCRAPTSCKEAKDANASATSGVYLLDPTGAGPSSEFSAFCDMTGDGGGWTLALKASGSATTFEYASPLWTSTQLLNPSQPAFDSTEAKLASFNVTAFTSVRIGMLDGGVVKYLVLPTAAASLRALFASAAPTNTVVGRAAWKSLMATPSLQPNCNAEGFNQAPGTTLGTPRVRIGIIGNEQMDCLSPDSWLGIGGTGSVCGNTAVPANIATSVGDTARAACGADNGDVTTRAFGYVFVR